MAAITICLKVFYKPNIPSPHLNFFIVSDLQTLYKGHPQLTVAKCKCTVLVDLSDCFKTTQDILPNIRFIYQLL